MKIIYLADIRLPTEKAHGFQVMKTCTALASEGNTVTLMIPSWNATDEAGIFKYYGIEKNFSIEKVPQTKINLIKLGSVGFALRSYFFARKILGILAVRQFDVAYSRDEAVFSRISSLKQKAFYEMHDVRKSRNQAEALRSSAGIIAISKGLKDYCISQGIDESKIIIAPDAVDADEFKVKESREEAREKLGLPRTKKIVLYSGHLYSWKGADVLAEAARELGNDTLTVFVGGTPWDIDAFKKKYGNDEKIMIVGQKPHSEIPLYLKAADVLALPNSAKEDISRLYTSPIKLFEYMASGTPIVASDLPSIREILDEKAAIFARPDDADSLAKAIKYSLENISKAVILSNRALEEVKKYSWKERAKSIEGFMKGHI